MPQQYIIKPLNSVAVAPGASRETEPVDLRQLVRVESLFVRGVSASGGAPEFDVDWVGGIQAVAFGDAEDAFQAYGANQPLLQGSTTESWQRVLVPDFRAPFVKFRVTADALAPADGVYSLFAMLRQRLDA